MNTRLLMGMMLFVSHAISQTGFNYFNPTDSSQIPRLLSQTRAYSNTAGNVINTRAVPFEVNAALWSDDAHKERWILLPVGRTLVYNDTADFFRYPESTVFIKTFSQERVQGNATTTFRWETRLLISKIDPLDNALKWHGFSYKWRANQSEADLVSRDEFQALDSAFTYTGGDGVLTYKKWKFPSKSDCSLCHRNGMNVGPGPTDTMWARSVLGFFPVQLKRMARYTAAGAVNTNANYNQISYLFDRGVFTGTRPSVQLMNQRWKGVAEALPPVTNLALRFRTLDTMARSYLGSNCSGCHGHRGLATGALQGTDKNWDYYRLKPVVAFDSVYTGTYGMNDTTTDTTIVGQKIGRQYYKLSVKHAGLNMTAGQPWDLVLPTGVDPFTLSITAVYPGYPSLSEIVYRQVVRNTPWNDSDKVYRAYINMVNRVCNPASSRYAQCVADSARASGRLTWLFNARWGSQAWLTTLNGRGYPLDSALAWAGGQFVHSEQMPPLATYIPDTSALKIMGEWIQRYDEALANGWVPPVGIQAAKRLTQLRLGAPYIRDQMLIIPVGMQGGVQMMGIDGRLLKLQSAGVRRYSLPSRLPIGIYYVKVGQYAFRLTMM